jgi:ABC-type multidrug transport system permease subunit
LALVLGIAFRNRQPDPVEAAVEARDGAEQVAAALRAASVRVLLLDAVGADEALRVGKVAIVVVPGDPLGYRFDQTRPESRVARLVVDDVLQKAAGRADPTSVRDTLVTEPGSRYIDFLIPGLLGFGLMSAGLWGVGFVLVDMRTRKLIKRMVATPMRRTHFLLSFVLLRALFLLAELPILIGFAYWFFGVPMRGSILLLTAIAVLGSLTFAGMGLLVASRTEHTTTVGGLINLVTIPMSLGSGVFFSSQRFPETIQPIIKAMPLTGVIDAFRAVMIDGAGLADVAGKLALFTAWGLVSFVIALRIFRWR